MTKPELTTADIESLQTIAERHTNGISAVNEWLKTVKEPPENIQFALNLANDIIRMKSFYS